MAITFEQMEKLGQAWAPVGQVDLEDFARGHAKGAVDYYERVVMPVFKTPLLLRVLTAESSRELFFAMERTLYTGWLAGFMLGLSYSWYYGVPEWVCDLLDKDLS